MVTFLCACFAKSSVLWIPLIYMSTSTQFQCSFVNLKAVESQQTSDYVEDRKLQKLTIVDNDDGSITIRAIDQVSNKKKFSSFRTKNNSQ